MQMVIEDSFSRKRNCVDFVCLLINCYKVSQVAFPIVKRKKKDKWRRKRIVKFWAVAYFSSNCWLPECIKYLSANLVSNFINPKTYFSSTHEKKKISSGKTKRILKAPKSPRSLIGVSAELLHLCMYVEASLLFVPSIKGSYSLGVKP